MPCILARTGSGLGLARPHRELATTPRAEAHANIPPRKRGRSWGRGHKRSQAPSPRRPEPPTRADPAQAFVQHLQDASSRPSPTTSDALGGLFPDAVLDSPSAANLPLHLKREYTAALNTLALFCPASVSTVDLGGNDWQPPARPHVVTASSLSDLVEAARLSAPAATTEPGVVTSHDASVVRKLGLGSCNLPDPHPAHPAAHHTPNTPATAPKRRLPPNPAAAHPPSPTLSTRPAIGAARLRCGALPPTPSAAPIPAPSSHAPLASPAAPRPATPLCSAAPVPPSAARLRSLTHAAPLPGFPGASRSHSPARAPACPTAPRTAAVCGPRRRIISEATSSSMRTLLAPSATPFDHPALPPALLPDAALAPATDPSTHPTAACAAPPAPRSTQPELSPAARLVAEHLGLGGQLLSAGDRARLGAVLESFDALAGPGLVPQHVGARQYSSWLMRRAGGPEAAMWHSAAQCALAPLVQ